MMLYTCIYIFKTILFSFECVFQIFVQTILYIYAQFQIEEKLFRSRFI